MTTHTTPPATAALPEADQNKYLIHSRVEIASILGTLCKAGTMVTAYFSGGKDFILTAIAAVNADKNEFIADFGADEEANQRALHAGKITFAAIHERIHLRFSVDAVRVTQFGGRQAFSMHLPATLLRLQRRESFRVSMPLTRPLKCIITGLGPKPAEVSIVDISCGGVAILDAATPALLKSGQRLRGCRIQLPEIGEIVANILIKSTLEVTLKNGLKHLRAGCSFIDLPGRDQAVIQRYINKLERESKVRGLGR